MGLLSSEGSMAMDWSTLLSTIAIIVFIVLMMRGCGGMMAGGGCGMGRRPRRHDEEKPAVERRQHP